jgi:single-stranded DNA-binding protein
VCWKIEPRFQDTEDILRRHHYQKRMVIGGTNHVKQSNHYRKTDQRSRLALSANGTAVCSFTLAVDRTFKNKDGQREADFIPVVAWRKTAELCGKYLMKEQPGGCERKDSDPNYDANDDAANVNVTEIVADEVHFIGSRPDGSRKQYHRGCRKFRRTDGWL